jgi:hypothetical protein
MVLIRCVIQVQQRIKEIITILQQNAADASRGRVPAPEYQPGTRKDRNVWTIRSALLDLAEGILEMNLIIRKFPEFELSELDRTARAFHDHIQVSRRPSVRIVLMPMVVLAPLSSSVRVFVSAE